MLIDQWRVWREFRMYFVSYHPCHQVFEIWEQEQKLTFSKPITINHESETVSLGNSDDYRVTVRVPCTVPYTKGVCTFAWKRTPQPRPSVLAFDWHNQLQPSERSEGGTLCFRSSWCLPRVYRAEPSATSSTKKALDVCDLRHGLASTVVPARGRLLYTASIT